VSSLDENPNCEKTFASFRLLGDKLDPDAATLVLTLEPTHALAKGQSIPAGRIGKARVQPTGYWSLSTADVVASTSLERHLLYLLDALEPSTAAIHALSDSDDIKADFFCYWLSATGNGGPEVSPETLGRIASLGASLGIDFYGPYDDDAEPAQPASTADPEQD